MEQFGGILGGFCLGGFVLGGILSRGILSGGFCPGDFVRGDFVLEPPAPGRVKQFPGHRQKTQNWYY